MAVIGFSILGIASLQVAASTLVGLRRLFSAGWEPPALSSLQFGRVGG